MLRTVMLLSLIAAGCGDDGTPDDDAGSDAGRDAGRDAGPGTDGGPGDGGVDAGPGDDGGPGDGGDGDGGGADAEPGDSGRADAGPPDGGPIADAGRPDAGRRDGGPPPTDTCMDSADCTHCVFEDEVTSTADCVCPLCPIYVMTTARCERNTEAFNFWCSAEMGFEIGLCPIPLCIEPPPVDCRMGMCVEGAPGG